MSRVAWQSGPRGSSCAAKDILLTVLSVSLALPEIKDGNVDTIFLLKFFVGFEFFYYFKSNETLRFTKKIINIKIIFNHDI